MSFRRSTGCSGESSSNSIVFKVGCGGDLFGGDRDNDGGRTGMTGAGTFVLSGDRRDIIGGNEFIIGGNDGAFGNGNSDDDGTEGAIVDGLIDDGRLGRVGKGGGGGNVTAGNDLTVTEVLLAIVVTGGTGAGTGGGNGGRTDNGGNGSGLFID